MSPRDPVYKDENVVIEKCSKETNNNDSSNAIEEILKTNSFSRLSNQNSKFKSPVINNFLLKG
jgi:hypothetical protein